jgi:hypothetical protein
MTKYESGAADQDTAKVPGSHSEPWLNIVSAYEPATQPALEVALASPAISAALRGKVIDLPIWCVLGNCQDLMKSKKSWHSTRPNVFLRPEGAYHR